MALRGERAADDLVFRRRLGDELVRYDVDNLKMMGYTVFIAFGWVVFTPVQVTRNLPEKQP